MCFPYCSEADVFECVAGWHVNGGTVYWRHDGDGRPYCLPDGPYCFPADPYWPPEDPYCPHAEPY